MGRTTHSPLEVSVALQGTLDTFALPDVLRLLAATKKTGRLRITGSRGTGSVWVTIGEVAALEATHAPHATEAVDALFELLRFEDGAFTFDAEATHDDPNPHPDDVEILLQQAEALLAEWREIEAVVPSMDAWVTLRSALPTTEVVVDQGRWTTIVAVGAGATVRRIGDELCLAELPISRAVKELAEAGLIDIAESAPAGAAPAPVAAVAAPSTNGTAPAPVRPLVAPKAEELPEEIADDLPAVITEPEPEPEVAPAPAGPRARRAKAAAAEPAEPEVFVPLDLPGHGASAPSYDEPETEADVEVVDELPVNVDDLAAAFPGLANRLVAPDASEDEAEVAKQLATLSPRAADAIRAAAEATTDEEREAALDAVDGEDQPLNRGLLLKFLSSVKS
jgi:Domain of unknown function (DUF4388)